MKRLKAAAAFAAAFIAFAAAVAPIAALAEDSAATYARANSREAYFYTDMDVSSAIFAVPYTYCVEVLEEYGGWYYVKYAEDYGLYRALYGYVKADDFSALSQAPETAYLYQTISVTFSQEAPANGLPALGDITVTAAFYGNYYSGAAGYSYVLYQSSFGYITGATEDYPLIESASSQGEEQPAATSAGAGSVTAWVILGVLAALALAIAALTGRMRGRKRRADPFAEENMR